RWRGAGTGSASSEDDTNPYLIPFDGGRDPDVGEGAREHRLTATGIPHPGVHARLDAARLAGPGVAGTAETPLRQDAGQGGGVARLEANGHGIQDRITAPLGGS